MRLKTDMRGSRQGSSRLAAVRTITLWVSGYSLLGAFVIYSVALLVDAVGTGSAKVVSIGLLFGTALWMGSEWGSGVEAFDPVARTRFWSHRGSCGARMTNEFRAKLLPLLEGARPLILFALIIGSVWALLYADLFYRSCEELASTWYDLSNCFQTRRGL